MLGGIVQRDGGARAVDGEKNGVGHDAGKYLSRSPKATERGILRPGGKQMTYTAPLADMRFALREVAGLATDRGAAGLRACHRRHGRRRAGGGRQARRQRPGAAQPRRRQGGRQAGERRGAHGAGIRRHLQGVRRGRLELAALRPGVRRPGHAVAAGSHGAGDVAGGQHGLRPGAAAEPGRDRRHPPSRLGRPEGDLPAQDDLGRMDRDHEPHRAAGRLGPRPAQEPRGARRTTTTW